MMVQMVRACSVRQTRTHPSSRFSTDSCRIDGLEKFADPPDAVEQSNGLCHVSVSPLITVAVLRSLFTDGLTLNIDLGESVLELCNGAVHKSSCVDIPI